MLYNILPAKLIILENDSNHKIIFEERFAKKSQERIYLILQKESDHTFLLDVIM